MNAPGKTRNRLAAVSVITIILLVLFALTDHGRLIILQQFDAIQLMSFAGKIDDADSATATVSAASSVHLTFTGAELQKILRGISSGKSARMPDAGYMSSAFATVSFRQGTNIVGQADLRGAAGLAQLFSIRGGPQFFDGTGLLNETVFTPLSQKLRESYSSGETR